jgi:hypothetical protein
LWQHSHACIYRFLRLIYGGEILTTEINEQQATKICENVGRLVVDEIETQDIYNKIVQMIENYLKINNIDQDAADLADKIEWSVKVKLKK